MNDVNVEALKQVIRVLKEVPPEQIRMEQWKKFDKVTGCGTSACAIGWAAQDPWFNKRGFVLEQSRGRHGNVYPLCFTEDRVFNQWKAVEEFFGLNQDEAFTLFAASHYRPAVTAQEVIERIQTFIDGRLDLLGSLTKGVTCTFADGPVTL